jgi:hypothetical protein
LFSVIQAGSRKRVKLRGVNLRCPAMNVPTFIVPLLASAFKTVHDLR